MKRFGIVAMVATALVAVMVMVVALSGCGKEETTIKTPEGEVTVGEKGGEVTIKTEEGEGTYRASEKPPTEEELGVPVHPKAKYEPGEGGGTVTYQGAQGAGSYSVAFYTVDAGFDEVVSWYKGKLGEPTATVVTDVKQATWYKQEGDTTIAVFVQEQEGKVTLTISKSTAK